MNRLKEFLIVFIALLCVSAVANGQDDDSEEPPRAALPAHLARQLNVPGSNDGREGAAPSSSGSELPECSEEDGIYDNKESGCTEFYYCSAHKRYNHQCDKGTLYDEEKKRCEWKETVTC